MEYTGEDGDDEGVDDYNGGDDKKMNTWRREK